MGLCFHRVPLKIGTSTGRHEKPEVMVAHVTGASIVVFCVDTGFGVDRVLSH